MEFQAPSRWRCIDFISDLHLHASEAETFSAWRDYMQHTTADAVFILGDLFEVWVGDDVLTLETGFEGQCANVIRAAAAQHDIFIMQGNRDFLMGPALMQACNSTFLQDTTVLVFAAQRWLLSHGDALCLADTGYLQFRQLVRSTGWQSNFLAKPLAERKEVARQLRLQSESIKRDNVAYIDLDTDAVNDALQHNQAQTMIHGHTHRPGKHPLAYGRERLVLSDWDYKNQSPRAEVLRIRQDSSRQNSTAVVERLSPAQACAFT